MENSFVQRYTFKFLMFLSLISGLIFLYSNHIDFISAAMEYNKMNVSNIGYVFLRIFGGVFIPLVFIVPSFFEYGRIKLARIFLILYGVSHIFAVSWIFYFLASQPALDIFASEKIGTFLTNGGFVYPVSFWDNHSLVSAFFALVYGIVAIYTGLDFDKDKSTAKARVWLLLTLRIALPLLYNILAQGRVFSVFWLTNNALEIASQLFFTVAIMFASFNNYTWIELVWDEIAFVENDDSDSIQ